MRRKIRAREHERRRAWREAAGAGGATAMSDPEKSGFAREQVEALAYLTEAWVLGILVAVYRLCPVGRLVEALRAPESGTDEVEAGGSRCLTGSRPRGWPPPKALAGGRTRCGAGWP